MLIIDSKDCENIDKALKKYKKKFEKAKILLQLRERQSFTKPSVKRRGEGLKAIYKQKVATGEIESYNFGYKYIIRLPRGGLFVLRVLYIMVISPKYLCVRQFHPKYPHLPTISNLRKGILSIPSDHITTISYSSANT